MVPSSSCWVGELLLPLPPPRSLIAPRLTCTNFAWHAEDVDPWLRVFLVSFCSYRARWAGGLFPPPRSSIPDRAAIASYGTPRRWLSWSRPGLAMIASSSCWASLNKSLYPRRPVVVLSCDPWPTVAAHRKAIVKCGLRTSFLGTSASDNISLSMSLDAQYTTGRIPDLSYLPHYLRLRVC
ncbi:hypothetical protein B0H12DRAFT_274298 [Mycena haematopus]|nr:hypothetical protein B0H12DRAFT_274298 [Mycena haematopus]